MPSLEIILGLALQLFDNGIQNHRYAPQHGISLPMVDVRLSTENCDSPIERIIAGIAHQGQKTVRTFAESTGWLARNTFTPDGIMPRAPHG
jgi:hypothetical protein